MKQIYIILLLMLSLYAQSQTDPPYPSAPQTAQNIVAAEYYFDTDPGFGNATPITITSAKDIANLVKSVNTTGLINGVHRLFIRSKNNEGRWSLTGFREFIVDFDPAYPVVPAVAKNIIAAEYYFDTDPGFGNGTPITITQGKDISNKTVAINTTGLAIGVHRVYIRTLNQEGRWSLTNLAQFTVDSDPFYPAAPVAAQNIVAAEYFVDTDPGFGNGTAITVTPGKDINNKTVAINTTGLAIGIHRVYIRTLNQEGRWSLTNFAQFTVDNDPTYPVAPVAAQNIIAAEYFVDNDPGFGKGTSVAITSGLDINDITVSVNTTGLVNGIHRVYIRTLSKEGRWSLTNEKDFEVVNEPPYPEAPAAAQNIIAAEYFIDADPGVGKGASIAITPSKDINNITAGINTTGLSNGSHWLFIRTLNQEGKWSLANGTQFYTDLLSLSADTINFGNVVTGASSAKNLIITNNSDSNTQTISSIAIDTPFSTTAVAPLTIAKQTSDTIALQFKPTSAGNYIDSIVIDALAGHYKTILKGTGIEAAPSWAIVPVSGHDYGNVAVGSTANYTFSISNTGNTNITLTGITVSDAAFTPSFTTGTVIAAGSSMNFNVSFKPANISAYTAQLKIISSTSGVAEVTAQLSGSGYNPGTPPALSYIPASPFNGNSGVNPASGQVGVYTYKVLYKSALNLAPQSGYPQIGIDINGDQDFNDLGEGIFTMVKDGNSTDYVNGVVYTYTYTHTINTDSAGYKFFTNDANGNSTSTAYKSGPYITDQQIDLRIFANDINFSNANPQPGEAFTLTATIHNSAAVPASNVPVRFYRDSIYFADGVIPYIGPNGTATITQTLSFAAEGFFPIKVWIDSSNTLGDISPLNNYAIRPVTVGSPTLPGGINVTTSATVQLCPQTKVIITGHAQYYGTTTPAAVAGATVTITYSGGSVTTYTNGNGDYTYEFTGVTCGQNFEYNVAVTDYTFTSKPAANIIGVPCPDSNSCPQPPRSQGGSVATHDASPCNNIAGTSTNIHFEVKLWDRDPNNFYNTWDRIQDSSHTYVFINDTLYQVIQNPIGMVPGETISQDIAIPLPADSTTPMKVVIHFLYTYVEFTQFPSATYYGHFYTIDESKTVMVQPEQDKPDLTMGDIYQTGATSFYFQDKNVKCVAAGRHIVNLYDSLPEGNYILIKSDTVNSVGPNAYVNISYSDTNMASGNHYLKIVIDANNDVDETDETNNIFTAVLNVPASDLSITQLNMSPSIAGSGSSGQVYAEIKNTGRKTKPFKVRFTINGIQVGGLVQVGALEQNQAAQVWSDSYIANTQINTCNGQIKVSADYNHEVTESDETNNEKSLPFSADISPYQTINEVGTQGNPVVVKVNTTNQFFPAVRNIGQRDAANVTVKYLLNNNVIGTDNLATVKAGEIYAAHGLFTYQFTAPGNYIVHVIADTANTVCESNEANNEGDFYIRVTDTKPDLEVLSQYISPSNLNPNEGQSITIVGTVHNTGGKVSTANKLRFYVDDVQLGNDVPFNAIQPGKDTTVAATATYSSSLAGTKIIKIVVDPDNTLDEEREDNNTATRAIIVGDAPDFAYQQQYASISFNPGGFVAGDNVLVSYAITNKGVNAGTGKVRFTIYDENNNVAGFTDGINFSLAAGANTVVSTTMKFDVIKGHVVAEIYDASPDEFNLLNNSDTLFFSNVVALKATTTINNNLDMEAAAPQQIPGWIGGSIILGDYDLVVHGAILNFDTSHFIITNGKGRLKLINTLFENTYPVGTAMDKTNFLKLKNTGVSDNFSVRVLPYVLKSGVSGDTIKTGHINDTWMVDEDVAGGSNVTATFFWNSSDEQSDFDRTKARAAHFISGMWQLGDADTAVADNYDRYSITQTGYTSFSPFTVTSDTQEVVLAVDLLTFNATPSGNDVLLKWTSSGEANTASFDVEFSTNGTGFTSLGKVSANNTAGMHDYTFLHVSPPAGVLYYRLKLVGKDGSSKYSKIVRVNKSSALPAVLYPNPATDYIFIKNIAMEATRLIQITATNGKVLLHTKPTSNMRYNISGLSNGVYSLQIIKTDGTTETLLFVKQK